MADQAAQGARPNGLQPSRYFATERIFPIRRLVDEVLDWSESSCPSPFSFSEEPVLDEPQEIKKESEYQPPPYPPVPAEHALKKLPIDEDHGVPLGANLSSDGRKPTQRQYSERSQLVPEVSGGEPGVLPGYPAHQKPPLVQRCEDEPIHIPGAIQQYGALVAVKYDEYGQLQVRIASENCLSILGYGVESLFTLTTFSDIIPDHHVGDFLSRVDNAIAQGHDPKGNTDLDVFEMTIKSTLPFQKTQKFWCAVHISAKSDNICICEFEAQLDLFFPGDPGRRTLPSKPIRTLNNEVVEEERQKSITRMSRPLRVLQIAQEQKHMVGFMEMFNAMSQIQSQLAACNSVQEVLDVVVGLVFEVSGFHRVMLYRFDHVYNGSIVAEIVDPRASDDLFRGLNFPASDIPKQARELYKVNKIRILFDRDQETARLVGREDSDFDQPLDLTHSFLRAMSPVHLKYLENMCVRSSMSISIIIDDKLWGLIACHSYGENGVRVSLPIRELCRNIGDCASINIARLVLANRLKSRGPPPEANHGHSNPSAFIAASSADLLRIFDADFGILSIQDEGRAIGRLDPYREALALLAHLQKRRLSKIVASQNVKSDFPTLKFLPGIKTIAGLLFIPLSMRGTDFIVFFRRAQLREVRWAGNPYERVIRSGTAAYLEPRSSFRRWTETVIGLSREWTDDQLETAAILGLLYGRFIDVWRQKEMASQKSRMTKLLLQNSSHEVRTPLNAIINYLEIALESPIERGIQDALESAHRASKSLVYVIDDLLNLAKAEVKDIETPKESFDLRATVGDVIGTFSKEAMRKNIKLTVSSHQGLPQMVKGEPGRFRQVLTNLAVNALQHTQRGEIMVDVRPKKIKETSSVISITVMDAGLGMSESQLDDLFQEFEQILDEDTDLPESQSLDIEANKKEAIGLGLSIVARWVRNMNGKIRVQSEEGQGTRFTLEVPFDHAGTESQTEPDVKTYPSPPVDGTTSSTAGSSLIEPSPLVQTIHPALLQWVLPLLGGNNAVPSGTPAPGLNHFQWARLLQTRVRNFDTSMPTASTFSEQSPYTDADMYPFPDMTSRTEPLSVLIAEDNPVNSKVLTRRLERSGHKVVQTVDGQACHDYFCASTEVIDVVLMDIQMPLVDGEQCTRMIRETERGRSLASRSSLRPRIPIFAVSASLKEDFRYDYVADGFDAWLLKPVNFNRLEILLRGVKDRKARLRALYTGGAGTWEGGGWLLP